MHALTFSDKKTTLSIPTGCKKRHCLFPSEASEINKKAQGSSYGCLEPPVAGAPSVCARG